MTLYKYDFYSFKDNKFTHSVFFTEPFSWSTNQGDRKDFESADFYVIYKDMFNGSISRGITFGYQWIGHLNRDTLIMHFRLLNYKYPDFEIEVTRFEYEDSLKKYLTNNLPMFKKDKNK